MNIAVIRNKAYDVSIVDLLSVQFEQHMQKKFQYFLKCILTPKWGFMLLIFEWHVYEK